MLLPTADRRRRSQSLAPIVVIDRLTDVAPLRRAAALAAARGVVLHVVVADPRPIRIWTLLVGRRPAATGRLEDRIVGLAAGPHVEIHRCAGRPSALAAGLAHTLGAEVVR